MYIPPVFKTDRAVSLAFAEARGFGTLCAWDGSRPIASSVPFYVTYGDDGAPAVAFHLARNNPLLELADGRSSWLLAVNGDDAYISPDWYASPDQVPTWIYRAVHLTGTVRKLADHELGQHLDLLSAKFENRLSPKTPWTASKMTAARLDMLKKAIVGLLMAVNEVEGSLKLNQHKSDADFWGVANALSQQPQASARALSCEMQTLRPQLFEAQPTQFNGNATPQGTT